ncbi:tRNA (guanosine(37)-N1)-methyltransferase TrmD [bacterium]|nr:tRNA (guanosine(37)-N1)-methyltransferase TrmD [Gemmatimonadota bacterium]MCH2663105.1 tRNA (guanosine(37)-N1)-methyltransferase TrmD [bacterium]
MRFDIITIFPDLVMDAIHQSIPGRAIKTGLAEVVAHDLRDYTEDKHKTVDDTPYGGGAGMIFKPEPLAKAIEDVREDSETPVIYMTAEGRRLDQERANAFSLKDRVILLCGHYRGIDERIRKKYVTDELSIGDYVLSGGELAALVLMDAVIRLIPGAIGDAESALNDSFQNGLLDAPWYTRPREFEGMVVPETLLNGDHEKIAQWRADQALERTRTRRPDLLEDQAE